jgi:hypothetical protein
MCVFGRGMLTGLLHSNALDIYVKILLLLLLLAVVVVVVVVVEIVVLSMPSFLFSSTFINEFS